MPRKGQFQKGNQGGPGRPGKDGGLICVHIEDYSEPPIPDEDCDEVELLEYELHLKEWRHIGFWYRQCWMTKKNFATMMDVYKAMKLIDPKAKLVAAYRKCYPDMLEEAFAEISKRAKK